MKSCSTGSEVEGGWCGLNTDLEVWLGMRMMASPVRSAVWWKRKIEPTALVTALLYLAVIDHPVIFGDQVKFYTKHSIFQSKGKIFYNKH